MRAICRALGDAVTEAPHFESTVFKVRGKIFSSFGDKNGVVVQLEPSHAARLLRDPRFEAYPRAKHTIMFDPADVGWTEAKKLVEESYRLVFDKIKPTKKR